MFYKTTLDLNLQMNNTTYLLKLFPYYKSAGLQDYIIKKLLFHDNSKHIVCHECEHMFVPNINCKTCYSDGIYKLECLKCDYVYFKEIKISENNLFADLIFFDI